MVLETLTDAISLFGLLSQTPYKSVPAYLIFFPGIGRLAQAVMFPMKILVILITCYLVVGYKNLMGMFYRISLIGMVVYFLKEGSRQNKIKINFTGYIRILSYLSAIFLIFFAVILVSTKFLLKNSKDFESRYLSISKDQLLRLLKVSFDSKQTMIWTIFFV